MLIFDVEGKLAHFRRPDTTVTHATYPIMTRTAALGLMAAVVGKRQLDAGHLVGIEVRSPVMTVSQQLSLLGKGWLGIDRNSFNRPTVVEYVVQPHYRLYVSGPDVDLIGDRIRSGQSHYHTYLGTAGCLTFPRFCDEVQVEPFQPEEGSDLTVTTVVPTHVVENLVPGPGLRYGRVGSMRYREIEDRRFEGSVHVVYEVSGGPVVIRARQSSVLPAVQFINLPSGETACLW